MKDHSRFACQVFGNFPPYGHGHRRGGQHGHHGPIGHHHGHKHHGRHHNKHHHGHHHMKHHHGHHFHGFMKGHGPFGHGPFGHGPFGHGPFGHGPFGHHKHMGHFRFGRDGRPDMEKRNCPPTFGMRKEDMKKLMEYWVEKRRPCCSENKDQNCPKNKDQNSQTEEGSQTVLVQRFVVDGAPRCYSV